jgi:hypothetical protein
MRDLFAIERYAATVRREQPSQDVEKSALSTAAGSDDGNEFSGFSAKADLLEDLQCITASGEGFRKVFNLNEGIAAVLFHIKKPLSLRGKTAF